MIDIIILSKNRACQLDSCIRSIYHNFPSRGEINILYRIDNTDSDYAAGYEKLYREAKNTAIFNRESNFHDDFINLLKKSESKYILIMCDDDIFIRDLPEISVNNIISVKRENEKIGSISLRLGENINFCHPQQRPVDLPKNGDRILIEDAINDEFAGKFETTAKIETQIITWDWTQCYPHNEFGYPHNVNGNIYDREYLLNLCERVEFKAPNSLEAAMDANRDGTKPLMASFSETKILNIPQNIVQSEGRTLCEGLSAAELNELYLAGNRIDNEKIYGISTNMCHNPIEYQFIKQKCL